MSSRRDEEVDPMGTLPMFDIPVTYRPPKRKTEGLGVSKWAKFTGRITCDLCILNVHDGISDTPLSRSKFTYTTSARKWHLCSVHAAQVRGGERRLSG